MTLFPLTSTLSRVSLLDRDMIAVFFVDAGSFLHLPLPGLLRFLRLVSYRMTAVTLAQRGGRAAGRDGAHPLLLIGYSRSEAFRSIGQGPLT